MAQITLNVKDAIAPEMITSLCANFNYQAINFDGTPNTETQAQFANRMIKQWLRDQVMLARRNTAINSITDNVL